MNSEILLNVISGFLSLIVAAISIEFIRSSVTRVLKRDKPGETYSQKLKRLTEGLVKSSSEVDSVLAELSQVARDREEAIRKLDIELHELEIQEKEQKDKVQALENVPIPVADHFANLTAASERRSALRDYALFGAGVILSTIIAIILQLLGT